MSLPTIPTTPGAPIGGQGDPRVPRVVGPPPRRRTALILSIVGSVVALLAAAVVAALVLFGSVTTSVPAGTVGEKLTAQFGATVSCTEDLPARVGATTTCLGTDDSGVHHILVTANSVEGSTVDFTGTVQD